MLFKKAHLTVRDAGMLLKKKIRLVGTEAMSIEASEDKSHPAQRMLLKKGVSIIENLDLKKAKTGYYRFVCLPLRIKDGDGAPVRAVLMYDQSDNARFFI